MNYYPHHMGDFNNATRHLTRVERSIYRDMIELYYDTEFPLTLDRKALCRKLIARTDEEATAVEQVLNEFFTETAQGWHHSRCEEEIAEYRASISAKSAAGKASAAKREADRLKRLEELNSRSTAVQQPFDSVDSSVQLTKNQEPVTKNQESITNPDGLVVPSPAEDLPTIPPSEKPDCPHQEIIALYHEVLPQCPQIREWTPARATQLRARWNESEKRQNLTYWRQFFEYVGGCDFLVGRTGKTPFFADLEWMTKSANFTKIREAKYENRAAA